jgi:hypothetical protein
MSYKIQIISSNMPGNAKITQLCSIQASNIPYDINIRNQLDNQDPYNNAYTIVVTSIMNTNTGSLNNIIHLDDAPQNGGYGSFYFSGDFVDYVMFAPFGGIYVPLSKLTWGTTFGGNKPSLILSPNSISNLVGPLDCEKYPEWTEIFSNEN